MGNRCPKCSCWKLFDYEQQASDDELSITEEVQLKQKPKVVNNRISKRRQRQSQLESFKRQEEAYFHHNNVLKLQERLIGQKMVSLGAVKQEEPVRGLSRDHSFYLHQVKGKLKTQKQNLSQDQPTRTTTVQSEVPSLQLKRLTVSPEQQQQEDGELGQVSSLPSILRGHESENVGTVQGRAEIEEELRDSIKGTEEQNKMRMGLVVGYLAAQDYQKCDQLLQGMLLQVQKHKKDDTRHFEVLAMLGYSAHLQQDHQNAIEYLLKAIRMGGQWQEVVEPFCWLGWSYLGIGSNSMARKYINKALRSYEQNKVNDPVLLMKLQLALGKLEHEEEEYVEADRHYHSAIRIAEKHKMRKEEVENLIEAAINYQAMENYKVSAMTIARAHKAFQRNEMVSSPLSITIKQTIVSMVNSIAEADLSQKELTSVVGYFQECQIQDQELLPLRTKLKAMKNQDQ